MKAFTKCEAFSFQQTWNIMVRGCWGNMISYSVYKQTEQQLQLRQLGLLQPV